MTIDPPTKLPTDQHREDKTDTDDTAEEKAKKATQENTATIDPPTQLPTDQHREDKTDTDDTAEEKTTISTNKKEVTFAEELSVSERPPLPRGLHIRHRAL